MKTYNFTNGKKAVKTYKEVSTKNQGCYLEGETIRVFMTDNLKEMQNDQYSTSFEEVEA